MRERFLNRKWHFAKPTLKPVSALRSSPFLFTLWRTSPSNKSRFHEVVKEGQCAFVVTNSFKSSCLLQLQRSRHRAAGSVCLFPPPAVQALTDPKASISPEVRPHGGHHTALNPASGGGQGAGPGPGVCYLPEPLNNRVVWTVAVLVNRMLSPVIHVHITEAAHEQLGRKFTRCKSRM